MPVSMEQKVGVGQFPDNASYVQLTAIRLNFPQPRFWIASGLPTIRLKPSFVTSQNAVSVLDSDGDLSAYSSYWELGFIGCRRSRDRENGVNRVSVY